MDIEDEVAALQRTHLFRGVDAARLRLIAISADRVKFKAGELIYAPDEPSEDVLLILSGTVRTEPGIKLETLVGHIGALLKRPRVTSVHADTDIEALRLGRDDFFSQLQSCNQFSLSVILELAQTLDGLLHSQGEKEAK